MTDKFKNLGAKADDAIDQASDYAEDVADTVEDKAEEAAGGIKALVKKINVTHVVSVVASAAAVAGMVLLARKEKQLVIIEADEVVEITETTPEV